MFLHCMEKVARTVKIFYRKPAVCYSMSTFSGHMKILMTLVENIFLFIVDCEPWKIVGPNEDTCENCPIGERPR